MIWDLISLTIIPLILSPLYFWYMSGYNPIHIIAFIGMILLGFTIEGIKKYILPNFTRPLGAKGCDLLCLSPDDNGMPGMPSGHCATVAFYGTYYGISSPLYYIYEFLIALSRYMKHCHSLDQIIIGIGLGSGIGFGVRKSL